MEQLSGKTAAITGAGSGIGRALALKLAENGCHLALSDIDGKALAETAALLGRYPVKTTTHIMDVADREQVYRYADDAAARHGQIDMIINNAGVAVVDSVEGVSYEDFEWLMGINFWGVVYGTKAFLPYLRKQPEGHVVNISSINGFVTWPNHSPYCSAKFAVKGFTEVLLQELDGTPIRVSCVHPGGIKTNIARNSRFNEPANKKMDKDGSVRTFEKMAHTTADRAAQIIVNGIRKNKRRILVGPDAYVIDGLTRLFPVSFVKFMGFVTKRIG